MRALDRNDVVVTRRYVHRIAAGLSLDGMRERDMEKPWRGCAPRGNKAKRDGRIRGEKRGGRWFYSIAAVRKLWPDAFPENA